MDKKITNLMITSIKRKMIIETIAHAENIFNLLKKSGVEIFRVNITFAY